MTYSLLNPLRSIPLAFFDVETTGASAACGDRVIEIGISRIENGQVAANYEQLIDPRRGIAPGVAALTGISQAMVDGQPTFEEILPRVRELLSGAILVGHNVGFDISFVASEFRRCGQTLHAHCGPAHILDTVRIARRTFGRGGNGLQRLSRRLGYEPAIAHRALPDAITTYEVFHRMLGSLLCWEMSLCDCIERQGGAKTLAVDVPPPQNPPMVSRRFASVREPIDTTQLPLELIEALEQRVDVVMHYVDANQRPTQRTIEPIQLRRVCGELVLIAHCHLRNGRRNFKLDRIVSLTRLSELQPIEPTRISTSA